MATDYDTLYAQSSNALGEPMAEVIDFFVRQPKGRRVLDLGCGQGRDALPIARLGHKVHGVDLSRHGIDALLSQASTEKLPITAKVADLVKFFPDDEYDIILADRTLHMLPAPRQDSTLLRLSNALSPGGWWLIVDEPKNMPRFETVLKQSSSKWIIQRPKPGILIAQAQ